MSILGDKIRTNKTTTTASQSYIGNNIRANGGTGITKGEVLSAKYVNAINTVDSLQNMNVDEFNKIYTGWHSGKEYEKSRNQLEGYISGLDEFKLLIDESVFDEAERTKRKNEIDGYKKQLLDAIDSLDLVEESRSAYSSKKEWDDAESKRLEWTNMDTNAEAVEIQNLEQELDNVIKENEKYVALYYGLNSPNRNGYSKKEAEKLQKEYTQKVLELQKKADELEKQIPQRKENLDLAKDYQTQSKYTMEAFSNENFENLSLPQTPQKSKKELSKADEIYYYINEIKHKDVDSKSSDIDTDVEKNTYAWSEDQIKIFNFYYNSNRKKEALEYADSLKNSSYHQLSENLYMHWNKGYAPGWKQLITFLEVTGNAVFDVPNQFKQVFSEEEIAPSIFELENEGILRNSKGWERALYQTGATVGNMLPHIALSYATSGLASGLGASSSVASTIGSVSGTLSMGTASAGSAINQALAEGYPIEQARTYGLLVGASEATLQYLLGGIESLGGVGSEKILAKVGMLDKAWKKIIAKTSVNIASEIAEEELQLFLEPAFKSIIFGVDYDAPEIEEMLNTALVTAFSTMLLGGKENLSPIGESRNAKIQYGDKNQTLALLVKGLSMGENTESFKLATKYGDIFDNGGKLNGTQLYNLVQSLVKDMHTSDMQKLTNAVEQRLTQLGESGFIPKIATAITKTISEETLSKEEKSFLKNSKFGQRVLNELNPKNIESGGYDTEWNSNLGTESRAFEIYNRKALSRMQDYSQASQPASEVSTETTATQPTADGGGVSGENIVLTDSEKELLNTPDDKLTDAKKIAKYRLKQRIKEQKAKSAALTQKQKNTAEDGGIATFGGIDAEEGRHLNQAQQQEIKAIGRKLGRNVVFENFYRDDKFKNKKKIPDGYIDKDGNIHINFFAKRPVYFIFKHEITHYLKRALPAYNDFMNMVLDSKAFQIWLRKRGYSSINALKSEIMDTYNEVEGFDEDRCYDEILADFVGERLFGGSNAINAELMNALEPKQKRTLWDVLKDIITFFKSKFSQEAKISAEISKIEKEFIKVYNKAVEVKENANIDGEQYAIAGKQAKTANKYLFFEAVKQARKGVDSEIIRKNTGWYKGKDGKWRFYIPDNALEVDNLMMLGDGVTVKLGDCIKHDKLFAAYPELKNLKICFDNLGKTKKGHYDSYENEIVLHSKLKVDEDKVKDTLVHEVQHAIQHIEGFAEGGNRSLGFTYAMNLAFEKVKNSQEFNNLPTKEEKLDYLEKLAFDEFDAESRDDLEFNAYKKIYGEIEAEQAKQNRLFDEDLLNLVQPDISGNVVDATIEAEKFIENFESIGYTEEEIKKLIGGNNIDQSRSFEDIGSTSKRSNETSLRRPDRNGLDIELPDGRFDVSGNADRGKTSRTGRRVQTKISTEVDSGRPLRGVSEENYSIPPQTSAEDLLEMYEKGEITREEYLSSVKKQKPLNPVEIANLTEEDASTTPKKKKQKGESKGNEESNFRKNLLDSDIFDDTFKEEAKGSSFIKRYQTVSNKETLTTAAKELDEGGKAYVNKWWSIAPERASLIDTAVGFILIDRYQRVGDYESAVAAAEKVREFGTASGQQVQIFSILGRLDPNSMAIYAQKTLSQAFETMVKGKTQAWIDKNAERFNLTEEEMESIRRRTLQAAALPEGRDKAIKLAEISTLLNDKLPPEKGQSLKALQRINMLLNAKTQIRNIVGNAGMVPVFITTDFFGSIADAAVSKLYKTNVRTTGAFDVKSVKGFAKGAYETLDDFKRHINTRNEELNRFELGSGKSFNEQGEGLFGTKVLKKQLNDCAKVLNALDRFTSFCLELGDRPFYEMWFINSLNNQIKLNKVQEATPEMIAIASTEALQRTWQDTNKVVKAVSNVKGTLNDFVSINGYGLGDVMIKFTKTPANLTKAIFDFSPAGLIKSIAVDGKTMTNALKTGQFESKMQKNFVDSFSKGVTGTLILVLAASLAKAGLLSGGSDKDKDIANFEKYIQGIPEYSIKIGDNWYSYEWNQPLGAIFAAVSDFMEYSKENPDNEWYENVAEAFKSGGQVLFDQSFMKSLQNLFTADNIIDGMIDSILQDPSVYVPQAVSQFANVTDDYRRVTYESDSPFKTAWNNVKIKIPGLRKSLEKQTDVLGRDVPNSQKNWFNAFFNPANTFTDTSTDVTDEVYDLYKTTGEKSVIPRVAPYSITVKGEKRVFSAEERREFQQVCGKTSNDVLEKVIKSDKYKNLTDEEKSKVVKSVYDFATAYTKSTLKYDYETISAIEGTRKNGEPVLTKEEYKKLSDAAKQRIVQEYFLSKMELRYINNYDGLANYLINQAKN